MQDHRSPIHSNGQYISINHDDVVTLHMVYKQYITQNTQGSYPRRVVINTTSKGVLLWQN